MVGQEEDNFMRATNSTMDTEGRHDLERGSVDSVHIMQHCHPTSHGTYLARPSNETEELEYYGDGGYHPIHIGDLLGPAERYRVIHKLGHGGFSTVWLCRDLEENGYVSVKVLAADVLEDNLMDCRLAGLDRKTPGVELINIPMNHFIVKGANGSHACLVSQVLGPRVSPDRWIDYDNPGPILRQMCFQAVSALAFLHRNGLCHGDFRPANILSKLTSLDRLSESELVSILGEPQTIAIGIEGGQELPQSVPRYLVEPVDISSLGSEYQKTEICVIDFGESFKTNSPPSRLGIPENYLPPEVLLGEGSIGVSTEQWTLGCTLFEIRAQVALFYMMTDTNDILTDMVYFFGKLPDHLWQKWDAHADNFDENGEDLSRSAEDIYNLDVAIGKQSQVLDKDDLRKVAKTMVLSKEEQRLFKHLLLRLCHYDPSQRLSCEDVLKHDWFKYVDE